MGQFLDLCANDVVQTVNEFLVCPSALSPPPLPRFGVTCDPAFVLVDRRREWMRKRRLSTALRKDAESKSFTDHLERELAQHFALAAVQVCRVPLVARFPNKRRNILLSPACFFTSPEILRA